MRAFLLHREQKVMKCLPLRKAKLGWEGVPFRTFVAADEDDVEDEHDDGIDV